MWRNPLIQDWAYNYHTRDVHQRSIECFALTYSQTSKSLLGADLVCVALDFSLGLA